jgi:hypothetical protein
VAIGRKWQQMPGFLRVFGHVKREARAENAGRGAAERQPKAPLSQESRAEKAITVLFFLGELGVSVRENPFCDGKGVRCGAESAAAAAARRTAPGDGPAFAKAMADKPPGKHICAHAQELITFSRGGKTDWGKKRRIFEVFF